MKNIKFALNMEKMKRRIRVVGASIVEDGKVLVAQRPESEVEYKSLKWEFPGGKIEEGETEEEAIKREIREELDCLVKVDALLPEMEYRYPDFILEMKLCICHLIGESRPKALEHNAIGWFTPEELVGLDWAAADALCYPKVIKTITNLRKIR